jgi:hypothetical protein
MTRAAFLAEDGSATLDRGGIEGAKPLDAALGGAAAAGRRLRPELRCRKADARHHDGDPQPEIRAYE